MITNIGINFAGGGGADAKLESKDYSLTANGSTAIQPSEGYDGISGGTIQVNVDMTPAYNSGYTEGHSDGIAEQKALLTSTTITENGSYTSENGFSAVTVDVQSGDENRLNSFFTNTLTAVTQSDLSGATAIRDYGFYGCSNLKSVDLPASVKTLGKSVFYNSGIKTLDVSNVTTYSNDVFNGCTSLTGLTGFENYTGLIKSGMFDGCTSLTELRTSMVTNGYIIMSKVFNNCKSLRSVTWLKNQDEVNYLSSGYNMYAGCTSMEFIDYTHNTIVPPLRFVNPFTAFTANYEIRVPDVLYDAWTATTNWNNSAIVGHIKAYPAQFPIPKLKYQTTGSDIVPRVPYANSDWGGTYKGAEFDASTGGTVTFWNNIKIPNNAFSALTSITSFEIPSGVTTIGNYAFRNCSALTSVNIANTVTSIGEGAFRYCHGLHNVIIPDSVTSIGDYVFNGSKNLASVSLGNGLTMINPNVFNTCTGLTTVEIGSNVTSIGYGAFADCSGLTTIICNAEIAPSFTANSTFARISSTGTLYVPYGSDYSSWLTELGDGWTVLPNYYARCTMTTESANETKKIGYTLSALQDLTDVIIDGVSVKANLVDDTYTFTDAGKHIIYYVYTSSTATLATEQTDIESYFASTAVNEIGNYALSTTWGSSKLASVYLPNVTSIGKQSINNVIATDIYAPKIQTIGNKGLQFNNNLDPVSMPLTGITYIDNNAFRQSAIKEAHFGSGLTTWNYNVFNECASLSALTFDANTTGLTTMPSVGYATTSLLEVTFPDCVQTYGQNASYGLFSGSTALTGVTFGSGTTEFLGPLFDSSMSAVTEIRCYATTAPIIQSGWMGGVTASTGTLYVPTGSNYSTWLAELGSNWTVSYM